MRKLRPLNDNEKQLVDEIVVRELIGGQEPSIGLHHFRLGPDPEPLDDGPTMVAFINESLVAHGSKLLVEEIRSYTVVNINLGPCCYLALVRPDGTRRPFVFGAYDPGVGWNEFRTGDDLAAHRLQYEAFLKKRKLEADAAAALQNLANRVGQRVQALLDESEPDPLQAQVLTGILPYTKTLGSYIQICLLMDWDHEEILQEVFSE